jgi:hypothetical protein
MRGPTIRLRRARLILSAVIVGGNMLSAIAQGQRLSNEELARRAIERRAVEAVIWGMPAVNYDLMLQAVVREAKGGFNQVIYWSHLPNWKIQTLTPNPDAVYFTPFIHTKEVGPMVLEIPPADAGSITGTIMDLWQSALEDVGPAGVDKGQAGKYLILPPGYKAKYQGYALLRSIPKSGSAPDVAREYFGPQASKGEEKNWIKTVPGKGWFTYLRFYSPTEAFFNQTWQPDDIIEVN